ncbi:MAG: GPW/gp25 family protein [Gammaproteobacteria bacterium]|nr:GPW/gp25 family protein [Alphaproteobacteria bacterium]MBU2407117.1 GPW/gp25 family protein [Gammaproteobacteria bacterium]
MKGMNSTTGKAIEDDAWIAQAVADVLLTPIGTRVMRRDYGSLLPALIDQPLNHATALQLYAASAGALRRWVPQLTLTRCRLIKGANDDQGGGTAELEIEGHRADLPKPNSFMRLTLPLPRLN